MTVGQIMSRRIITISMDDSLAAAQSQFAQHRFHHLLVVEHGRLVGVISDRDLLKNLSPFANPLSERSQDAATLKRRIHQVMTRAPVTMRRDSWITEAARVMLDTGVSCLPVVDDRGAPVGILSWRDLLDAMAAFVPQPAAGESMAGDYVV